MTIKKKRFMSLEIKENQNYEILFFTYQISETI